MGRVSKIKRKGPNNVDQEKKMQLKSDVIKSKERKQNESRLKEKWTKRQMQINAV